MPGQEDSLANWKPLDGRLPVEECAAFMYMGNDGDIHLYKHGDSRRYLCLDEKGNCFTEDAESGKYVPADFAAEYAYVTGEQRANAFDMALNEVVGKPALETTMEPGGGRER